MVSILPYAIFEPSLQVYEKKSFLEYTLQETSGRNNPIFALH